MSNDRYLHRVLTVIAAALVYLCVVLTPVRGVQAQTPQPYGAPTPGGPAAPGQVIIVGWQTPADQPLPVRVVGKALVDGDVRVSGRVETTQAQGAVGRVVLAGWEPEGPPAPGTYTRWNEAGRGLPVVTVRPQP